MAILNIVDIYYKKLLFPKYVIMLTTKWEIIREQIKADIAGKL